MMATNTGHVMNLANSIIGVSLLAMPFCFKQCGITLAIVMLILSSIISRLACYFLVKSSTMCRRRNFEFLAFYTFGPSGKLLVELGVIGFMMGTCVAFFVVMGDLGPAIVSKLFNINNTSTLRSSVLIGLGVLVVLPLGLLRNVESLAAISTVTIGFYVLFILKIFFESTSQLFSGDWWYHVNFWQPEGILQCIPIFAMALSCQTQLFEIYESLPMPSLEKINGVVHSALNLCTIVYTCVGLLGYIAYCKGTFTGNILLSFSPSLSSEMFKLGFVMSIAVSFPLVIFPCRASLYSLIFKRTPIHHELTQTSSHIPDSRFKCLTIAIVGVALMTGLLIPSIELVLGFVGSTIGIAICVIFPSLSFIHLTNKDTNERLTAKVTLFIGMVIMIMGTCGNLFAAVENEPLRLPPDKVFDSQNLPQLRVPPKLDVSTQTPKKYNKELSLIKPIPPEILLPVKSNIIKQEVLKNSIENQRKEPPVPVAPIVKPKDIPKQISPQIKVIEVPKNEENLKEVVTLIQVDANVPELKKPIEKINKDAIEKENREIMEVEKLKKTEEEEKQRELLLILKKHQDEQKKLLREQEKILIELKHREKEKKLSEAVKDKQPSGDVGIVDLKTIKPDDFKVGIKKIQNVLDNLKDTKNSLEKDKVQERVNILKEKPAEEPKLVPPLPEAMLNKYQNESESKHRVISGPIVKSLPTVLEAKKIEVPEKSKQEVLGRDILLDKKSQAIPARKKREVGDPEECQKNDLHKTDEGKSLMMKEGSFGRSLILENKKSEVLEKEESDRNFLSLSLEDIDNQRKDLTLVDAKSVKNRTSEKENLGFLNENSGVSLEGGNFDLALEKSEKSLIQSDKSNAEEKKSERSLKKEANPLRSEMKLIKNSKYLSLGLAEEKKLEFDGAKASNIIQPILNQALLPKKRDLKSVGN